MNGDDTHQFLDTIVINRQSRYTYITSLRAFRALALERTPVGKAVSIETLRAWLTRDAARAPLANVVQRAAIISRYLNWRAVGTNNCNPLAALQNQYGRRLTPIIRALLEAGYTDALEKLRPLPHWGSPLGPLMREHIARMRSLGYRYEVKARDLRRFDRFVQQHKDLAHEPLSVLLAAWRRSCRGIRHELRVQQCGRTLTQAMHRNDATTTVLSIDPGLQRRVIRAERKPYIFTDADVAGLFEAARTFPSRHAPLRSIMLRTMLTLAYCAGLRIGEIAALTLGDIDTRSGIIEIRETKFFKSRRLPLAPSVSRVLAQYMAARHVFRAPSEAIAPLWWCVRRQKAYRYGSLEKLMRRLIYRAGLKPSRGRCGPRPHDLRHTFVAHRMLQWYREGVDPQTRLPHLATYLGHKDIVSTLVYLNTTPELLRQASERHRQRSAAALSAGGRP